MSEPARRGAPTKDETAKKGFSVHARLSPSAHAKLLRLAAARGGTRGAITAALEDAILAAPDPDP